MEILSGSKLSKEIQEELKREVELLKDEGIQPTLAVILVGEDPASAVYVKNKGRMCEKLGINSIETILPKETPQEELLKLIKKYNRDKSIHGILCQVPLPEQCDEQEVIETIDPIKDVDCFHPYNLGLLTAGIPRFLPCTPFGVLQIIKRYGHDTKGKKVAIVGRSNIVGRPLSILMSLKGWDATVTVCHSKTENLADICREADIVVGAIGKAKFITADFFKKGSIAIDVGINWIEDQNHPKGGYLVGDIDFDGASDVVGAITPVPKGVGPMTIQMLMYNTINAARLQADMPRFEL